MSEPYDVAIIGAGPAGYVAAIRCAQLGLNTALVDDWLNAKGEPAPGGTCLNVGCIPSKALLESSLLYEKCRHEALEHGIDTRPGLDLGRMMKRKAGVVADLTGGVRGLLHSNGVSLHTGRGRLLPGLQVEVLEPGDSSKKLLSAQHVILASGSSPRPYDAIPLDGQKVVDSSGALAFDTVPERLAIIGAGVIALELGTVWRRLGSQVSLFKSSKQLLPGLDPQISRTAASIYQRQGLRFNFGTHIDSAAIKKDIVDINYRNDEGEQRESFDKVIIAVGRVPNSEGLFAEELPLKLDDKGRVVVDAQCRTNIPDVYAIGDLVRGPMLAHKGSEEGLMVAERIAGHFAELNYDTIPSVIYTAPEIAWCGMTESALKEKGVDYKVGSFPFAANGRAKAGGDSEGFIKILADARTDRVLGVHMIGPHCSELIAQAVIAMEYRASSEDLALMVFAHPSLSESMHEAALDVHRRAIHKGYV